MNAKELAKKSGLHYNTIYKMIKSGELEASKEGKTYNIDEGSAFKLIIKELNSKSEMNTQYGINKITYALNKEKERAFAYFILSIKDIVDEYSDFLDSLEEMELENLRDNIKDTEAINIAINKFESQKIIEILQQYEETKLAIKAIKANKSSAICDANYEMIGKNIDFIKKKINKDMINSKDFIENMRTI